MAAVVAAACEAGQIGFDTEFVRERTYRAQLCLVQVAAGEEIFLIDPLTGVDLSPLARLISDPEVEIVVHAGRQDLEILFDRLGAIPTRVYDVQIAAGFTGYGASLPYGRLVHAVTGVHLEKGESYSDWCRRPLSQAQLQYAADDVKYLEAVARRLKQRAEELGRSDWVAEEMAELCSKHSYDLDLDEVYRKVAGRGNLSGGQLAVLREVARWREETARRRDIPRGWVLKDPTMIEIARRAPSKPADLAAIRGISAKEVERSGAAIIDAVQRGRRAQPIAALAAPPREAQIRARMLVGVADAVVRARCEREKIAYELVATRAELEGLLACVFSGARPSSDGFRLLRGWRRRIAGEAVVDLALGRIAVRAKEEPPFVEEVVLES